MQSIKLDGSGQAILLVISALLISLLILFIAYQLFFEIPRSLLRKEFVVESPSNGKN